MHGEYTPSSRKKANPTKPLPPPSCATFIEYGVDRLRVEPAGGEKVMVMRGGPVVGPVVGPAESSPQLLVTIRTAAKNVRDEICFLTES